MDVVTKYRKNRGTISVDGIENIGTEITMAP